MEINESARKAISFLLVLSLGLAALSMQVCVVSNMDMSSGSQDCPMLSACGGSATGDILDHSKVEPGVLAIILVLLFVLRFQFKSIQRGRGIEEWLHLPPERPPQSV